MARCGISLIDDLLAGGAQSAVVGPSCPDKDAVGAIQDLLIGQGYAQLPGVLGSARGVYGPKTCDAVSAFRSRQNLPTGETVDTETLTAIVHTPAADPIASRAYVTLALDFDYDPIVKLACITAQCEGQGRFAAINANTDRAGLSFGIIQWAQKPGRLAELLCACQAEDPAEFARVMGGGGLITYVKQTNGGVTALGTCTDANYDLTSPEWIARFKAAALLPCMQRAQVKLACAAFRSFAAKLHLFAPELKSERAVAFMLDLANQHGEGGARSLYTQAKTAAASEAALLLALTDASVAKLPPQFQKGTRARRDLFRTTDLLSDEPFDFSSAGIAATV